MRIQNYKRVAGAAIITIIFGGLFALLAVEHGVINVAIVWAASFVMAGLIVMAIKWMNEP